MSLERVTVTDDRGTPRLVDVSLDVRAGEIVGSRESKGLASMSCFACSPGGWRRMRAGSSCQQTSDSFPKTAFVMPSFPR